MSKLFLSYERPDLSPLEQVRKRAAMEHSLDMLGAKWERVEGVFEGQSENSYMVTATYKLRELKALAKAHNQDSVLFVTAYKGATIMPICKDVDDGDQFLGYMEATKDKPTGDYTFNYATKEYYVIK